ncbi:MAG: hypothetical protein ACRDJ9_29840, partial [Dehalococcoidia bacterium]
VRAALVLILIGGLIWATDHYQLIGAISVVVGVSMLERLVVGVKVARIVGMTRKDWILFKDIAWIACAAMVAAIAALWVRELAAPAGPRVMLMASALAFGPAYGIAVAALKILDPEEIGLIGRQLERVGIPPQLLRHAFLSPKRAPGS